MARAARQRRRRPLKRLDTTPPLCYPAPAMHDYISFSRVLVIAGIIVAVVALIAYGIAQLV